MSICTLHCTSTSHCFVFSHLVTTTPGMTVLPSPRAPRRRANASARIGGEREFAKKEDPSAPTATPHPGLPSSPGAFVAHTPQSWKLSLEACEHQEPINLLSPTATRPCALIIASAAESERADRITSAAFPDKTPFETFVDTAMDTAARVPGLHVT